MSAKPSFRGGLAGVAFGVAGAGSYAVQRLIDASQETPAYASIIAQEHIPYYWRCDLALLHGVVAAVLVGVGVREGEAERWLGRTWLIPLIVLPLVLSMLLVP